MKKKVLALLLTICTLFACALGLGSCGGEEGDRGTEGISYELIEERNEYRVLGRGEAEDAHVVIPATYNGLPVTEIVDDAFAGDEILESIKIGNNVKQVGIHAFLRCKNLKKFLCADKPQLTTIKGSAFRECEKLEEVEIPHSTTTIGSLAFYQCSAIRWVIIPTSVTTIESSMFAGCVNLEVVDLPSTLNSIEDYAFNDCAKLARIEIGIGVTHIGDMPFLGCENLTIYCESAAPQEGWSTLWNISEVPVVWNYTI